MIRVRTGRIIEDVRGAALSVEVSIGGASNDGAADEQLDIRQASGGVVFALGDFVAGVVWVFVAYEGVV